MSAGQAMSAQVWIFRSTPWLSFGVRALMWMFRLERSEPYWQGQDDTNASQMAGQSPWDRRNACELSMVDKAQRMFLPIWRNSAKGRQINIR